MRAHKILPNGTSVRVMERRDLTGIVVGHSVIQYGDVTGLMYIVQLDHDVGGYIHRDDPDKMAFVDSLVVHPDNIEVLHSEEEMKNAA